MICFAYFIRFFIYQSEITLFTKNFNTTNKKIKKVKTECK